MCDKRDRERAGERVESCADVRRCPVTPVNALEPDFDVALIWGRAPRFVEWE